MLSDRGVRTKNGKNIEKRFIDYMLHNPCYIGKIRLCLDGTRSVSNGHLDNENLRIAEGLHEPIISMDLWDKAQKRLEEQKRAYPKHAKREQPINHMLKGLIRCGSCGGTLAISGAKGKVRYLQCCNYSRASCYTSHSIAITRAESTFLDGLKTAVSKRDFRIVPNKPKQNDANAIDFDRLIAVEERRLARAKEAYLAGIDTIEQYAKNKKEITERIDDLKARKDKDVEKEINIDVFAEKVAGIVEFIEREDVTVSAKNEALHTIIEKIVFEKAKGNLAIYFHDI
jgi:hypothetical protein